MSDHRFDLLVVSVREMFLEQGFDGAQMVTADRRSRTLLSPIATSRWHRVVVTPEDLEAESFRSFAERYFLAWRSADLAARRPAEDRPRL